MNFNKLQFPRKPVDVQFGTISENACIINLPNFMLALKSAQFA